MNSPVVRALQYVVVVADEEVVGPFATEADANVWARDNFEWERRTVLPMWDSRMEAE